MKIEDYKMPKNLLSFKAVSLKEFIFRRFVF